MAGERFQWYLSYHTCTYVILGHTVWSFCFPPVPYTVTYEYSSTYPEGTLGGTKQANPALFLCCCALQYVSLRFPISRTPSSHHLTLCNVLRFVHHMTATSVPSLRHLVCANPQPYFAQPYTQSHYCTYYMYIPPNPTNTTHTLQNHYTHPNLPHLPTYSTNLIPHPNPINSYTPLTHPHTPSTYSPTTPLRNHYTNNITITTSCLQYDTIQHLQYLPIIITPTPPTRSSFRAPFHIALVPLPQLPQTLHPIVRQCCSSVIYPSSCAFHLGAVVRRIWC